MLYEFLLKNQNEVLANTEKKTLELTGDHPGRPEDAELAKSSGLHGNEMLRLGYALSQVVHAYGALCQAVTEAASKQKSGISADEFHAFNRCLDVAIASAATTDFRSIQQETVGAGGACNVGCRMGLFTF